MSGNQKHRGFIRERGVKTRSVKDAEKNKLLLDTRRNLRDLKEAYDILLQENQELKKENEKIVFKMMRMDR